MKAIIAEWIAKAEGDWTTAEREWRARKHPNYDAVCFHAQQCAEKYIKARMREEELEPPKIHDLLALLDRVAGLEPAWESFRQDMTLLTQYSAKFRYPGDSATKDEAQDAMRVLRRFRKEARATFRLD
jgi:HEPN domain-containing protein